MKALIKFYQTTLPKLCISILVGVIVFWICRLATWFGSLTTMRTPFYFMVNYGLSWVAAIVAPLVIFFIVLKDT